MKDSKPEQSDKDIWKELKDPEVQKRLTKPLKFESPEATSGVMSPDVPKEPGCTLKDAELIERSEEWISNLAKSGGKKWCLHIPVNFNRDPDMLFSELCNRVKIYSKELSDLRAELEIWKNKFSSENVANVRLERAYRELAARFKELEAERDKLNESAKRWEDSYQEAINRCGQWQTEYGQLKAENERLKEVINNLHKSISKI